MTTIMPKAMIKPDKLAMIFVKSDVMIVFLFIR